MKGLSRLNRRIRKGIVQAGQVKGDREYDHFETDRLRFRLTGTLAAAATPAFAQPVPQAPIPATSVQTVSVPTAGAVATLYDQFKLKPFWFKNGAPTVAVTQLQQILRRARVDGLGNGPELAVQVENAVRQAALGNPADIAAAEQAVSAAWVLYVQTIKRPTPGMIYVFDVLKPQATRTDQILLAAANAPSLRAICVVRLLQ